MCANGAEGVEGGASPRAEGTGDPQQAESNVPPHAPDVSGTTRHPLDGEQRERCVVAAMAAMTTPMTAVASRLIRLSRSVQPV